MTTNKSLLHDTIDISSLDLLVDHPNGSFAKIDQIGNLQFSNALTLFDIFAIPDFNLNLFSIHKLCKDTKCEVFLMNIHVKFTIRKQRRLWRMVGSLGPLLL